MDNFKESDLPPLMRECNVGKLQLPANRCRHCKAFKFKTEPPGFCCKEGRLTVLDLPPDPPEVLLSLYTGEKREAFLGHITQYNSSMAMASIGCTEKDHGGWNPTFKIQGKMYHSIGALLPSEAQAPAFAQIYFYDSELELEHRRSIFGSLRKDILQDLQHVLHEHNTYVRSFKQALDHKNEYTDDVRVVLHSDKTPMGAHPRTYNAPTASEVAVIATKNVGERDIIVWLRAPEGQKQLQRISHTHRSYDPLSYPVLFFSGIDGWSCALKGVASELAFYRYRLQVRDGSFNIIMRSRRLMQMYATDMWHGIESSRLQYDFSNQEKLRAEKYQGLMDAISDGDTANVGTKVILPATFYASPRWYAEQFQDSMAIVRKFGKPDFFITMTTNPNWPEILESLFPGEQPHDRPDLCVRVFKQKVDLLLEDILKNEILGKVEAYVYSKEDQKRGLPHIHLLLIMADKDKCRKPEDIDNRICAELPNKATNPVLFDIITRHNIHGPCGIFNKDSPCMTPDGLTCTKSYPKDPCTQTAMGDDSFPRYRRRLPDQGGFQHEMKVKGKSVVIDNTWVVPYSAVLSLKYNCHINVEEVATLAAVKYLFKYITKGSDKIIITLKNGQKKDITLDEIEQYVNARYISASSAFWRIFSFSVVEKSPSVLKLPLHLENEQTVLFDGSNPTASVSHGPPNTKLLAWFQLNLENAEARAILYPDIPMFFVWVSDPHPQTKVQGYWKSRTHGKKGGDNEMTKGNQIGRIPTITLSPHQSELWHLRLLLYHKPGATSFEDLRTIEGTVHATFQGACLALGLLDDDNEKDKVMEEASTLCLGPKLRKVFTTLLVYCRPADPLAFWGKHKDALSDDFKRGCNALEDPSKRYDKALLDIGRNLEAQGLSLKDFLLPTPVTVKHLPQDIEDETSYRKEEEQLE